MISNAHSRCWVDYLLHIAKDSDTHIPLALIKQIIEENSGLSENDAFFLLNQIMHFKDEQDNVNFVELLKNFEIN